MWLHRHPKEKIMTAKSHLRTNIAHNANGRSPRWALLTKFAAAVLGLSALALLPGNLTGQSAEDLRLTVGKSVVIDYPSDIRQISTSNPDIVDASPVTTREILLHGKGVGAATMVVWSKVGQRTFYNVTVDLNLDSLRRTLREDFPGEKVEVRPSRDAIALTGVVSSKDVSDRLGALSATYGKVVVNNLQIASAPVDKQILLRVKFAQLDRLASQDYGVNFISTGAANTIGGVTTGPASATITSLPSRQPGVAPTALTASISNALNIFAFRPDLNLGAFIKALEGNNILQILAEPNIVTSNGKEANFLVGGEFPVPTLQGGANSGAVTVQFREFGIRLSFLPQLTANKTIKMYIKQEVSTIDTANGVVINGFTIPALATRRAETNVELGEGQSFIVAGLVDNRETDSFSKIPVLSSLPIFGSLFKVKSESKNRSELVMMITPEITEPLNPSDAKPMPTFPRDFLVRLTPDDLKKDSTKPAKKK
jgi:pilus assembly protein CpaC